MIRVRPFVAVICGVPARLTGMSRWTSALTAAAEHTVPTEATCPATADELAAQLVQLNTRLAAATAEPDAYRDALVRIRLAMHGMRNL